MEKKIKFSFLIIIIIFVLSFFISFFLKEKSEIKKIDNINVYYRVYSGGKWSKWVNNGLECGNKINNINKIQIDFKTNNKKFKNKVSYNIYSKNSFSKDYFSKDITKQYNSFSGIIFDNLGDLRNEFDIYYKTYNKKNGWLNWAGNGDISGNKKEPIKAIRIKIVPKNAALNDYLEGYNSSGVYNLNFD